MNGETIVLNSRTTFKVFQSYKSRKSSYKKTWNVFEIYNVNLLIRKNNKKYYRVYTTLANKNLKFIILNLLLL